MFFNPSISFVSRRRTRLCVPSSAAPLIGVAAGRCYETQLHAAQLDETLAGVPAATLIPLAGAFGLALLFWGAREHLFVLGVLAATTGFALSMLIAARLTARRSLAPSRLRVAQGIAVALAAALGVIWGAVPIILFPGSNADGRLIILAAIVGVIANCYRLGPLTGLGVAYISPICAGSFIGLAASGSSGALVLSCLVPLYGWFILTHCQRINAASARRIVDRLRVAEQDETIHALLLDFDETTSDWIWRTDETGRMVDVCDSLALAADHSIIEIEGAPFESLLSDLDLFPLTNDSRAVVSAFRARKPFRNQLVEIKTAGPSRWWRLSGRPLFDKSGAFLGYHGIGSDMTGTRNSESRIAYLANYDTLTGFANRANFQLYASHQCKAASVDGQCRALLCVDLDSFKSVNDNFGHDGGDEVLKQVAERFTSIVPAGTFLARLGGDEFALWLETTPGKAEIIARELVEALREPFDIHGLKASVGASIGVAFTPIHSTDPDNLMVKADIALYRAKAEGKGRVCVFIEAFETAMIERRKLENDIKLALARGEFELHYQPQVEAGRGRVVGFEALIRWNSPERGFVSPVDFIPVAESTGLIAALGRWVLFEACRTAVNWPSDIHVAVNVSPPQVRARDFMQDVAMALKTSGLHPSRLEIEVTEGVFLDESPIALENLRTLRTRGVRVALDDFGTGYSSLSYLVAFPVDRIKIDRSFIRDLVGSSANQAIVDSILGLAKTLSMKVTAEGVETKEQALLLKRRRCDDLQGYLFSRPRPARDIDEMVETAPELFRQAIPTHLESPLALVLEAARRQAVN